MFGFPVCFFKKGRHSSEHYRIRLSAPAQLWLLHHGMRSYARAFVCLCACACVNMCMHVLVCIWLLHHGMRARVCVFYMLVLIMFLGASLISYLKKIVFVCLCHILYLISFILFFACVLC